MRAGVRFWAILGLLQGGFAEAKDICQEYRNWTPVPEWYSNLCFRDGTPRAGPGGAFSTLAAPFNLNPAMIPTVPIPYGAEYIYSATSGQSGKHNFALLKGRQGVGLAVSTNKSNSIYSSGNSLVSRESSDLSGRRTVDNAPSSTSLGTAFSPSPFFSESMKWLVPAVGVLYRQNPASGNANFGWGAALTANFLSLSYAQVVDPASSQFAASTTHTYTAGLKFSFLQIEAAILQGRNDPVVIGGTTVPVSDPDPTYLITSNLQVLGFVCTVAYRAHQDATGASYTNLHLAVQKSVTRWLSVGFFNDYLPGYRSLGVQVLL